MLRILILIGMLWTALYMCLLPGAASAHAVLVKAVPAEGARLSSAPKQVVLVFNEKIESATQSLQVLDQTSEQVASKGAAVVSEDEKTLTLDLPALKENLYTVTYKVISADGHPVSGSYVFVVGNPLGAEAGLDSSSLNSEAASSSKVNFLYVIRFLYYGSLMLAAGLMLWKHMLTYHSDMNSVLALIRKKALFVNMVLLLVAIVYVIMEMKTLLVGDNGLLKLLTSTTVGYTFDILLLLSLIGIVMPRLRSSWITGIWALLLLAQEAWDGHAAAAKPKWAALLLDYVHLIGGALWAGGLMLLVLLWYINREEAKRFAVYFSSAAWISIAVLSLSGIGLTLLYLPAIRYLFYTDWGTLLLIKSGLVVAVMVTGFLLRTRIKRKKFGSSGILLKVDGVLMLLILFIVGIFTYLSPQPANHPVKIDEFADPNVHYSIRISPNAPGDNQFALRIWLPEQVSPVKNIKLLLRYEDKPNMGAITIPLKPVTNEQTNNDAGYDNFAYEASGPYIPFAGHWQAEVRIQNSNDDEIVQRIRFNNY